jgi:hypothetical protein
MKDGITVKDLTGSWYHDEAEARAKAIVIAERVGQVEEGLPAPARLISIRDEAGRS